MNKSNAPKSAKTVDGKDQPERPEVNPVPTPESALPAADVSLPDFVKLSDSDLLEVLKGARLETRRREKVQEASRPTVGSQVRIVRGKAKFVGKVGTAVIVRKTRCFVTIPELKAPAYVLLSDLEKLSE